MKRPIFITLAMTVLCVTALRAQDSPEPPGALPNPEASLKAVQAEAQNAQAEAQRAEAEIKTQIADSWVQRGRIDSGRRASKGLVIRSSETDPKEQEDLETDLAVMSYLLNKAVGEKVGGQPGAANVLGIDVFYYTPGPNPLRSLYLEGYGALFMLNVGFPLLPPPTSDARNEKPEADSDWETAKAELYGPRSPPRVFTGPVVKYDEEKVDALKTTLLETLKNGTNIRELKPDDSVTVCIFGGPSGGSMKYKVLTRGSGPGETRAELALPHLAGAPARQSMLTIRVKKSDIDALAKSKMNLDEFRKRARITVYAGNAEGNGMPFGAVGGGYGVWSSSGGISGGGFGGGR